MRSATSSAFTTTVSVTARRGYRELIEVHLLFPHSTAVGEAHRLATALEERLPLGLGKPAEVITHLESLEDHEDVHATEHYTGRPD